MSDTTARDQLAELVAKTPVNDEGDTLDDSYWDVMPKAEMIADAILAAGWRPPARTVTTVEEVEALADMTVVLESGLNWRFVSRKLDNNYWLSDGIEDAFPSMGIGLPATVLYEPEEGE